MSKAIALVRQTATQASLDTADLARTAIVGACAIALIAAGPFLPL